MHWKNHDDFRASKTNRYGGVAVKVVALSLFTPRKSLFTVKAPSIYYKAPSTYRPTKHTGPPNIQAHQT